jgi:fucose permease
VVAPDRLRRATAAVYAVFILSGFAFASWASRIPAIRDALELTPRTLGLVLLAMAVGSVTSMPLSGLVVGRLGTARTVGAMALLAAAGLVTAGLGYRVGVAPVEQDLGRAIMPRFHAGFSVGTVAGALVGAAMVALGVSATVHLLLAAAIVAAVVPRAVRDFLPDSHAPAELGEPRNPLKAWTEPRTLLIGLFVFSAAFTEGTGNDWLGVAVIDGYGAAAALGALTFAIFLAAMTLGRWFGPGLIDRHGRVLTIRVFGALALAGLALVVWGSALPVAMAGAALWGLGTALGFPVGMSAAGDDPEHAPARVSVVATVGYVAFLAGPPLIGFLGEHTGTLRALTVTGGLVALGLMISGVLRPPTVPERAPAAAPASADAR